ncbi:MAG: hypothetical protein ABJ327_17695 [Litoreibacter sp.]
MDSKQIDPKGLIRESYRIEGITLGECKSIFLDWALSLEFEADTQEPIEALLETYGTLDHPMTQILREGLSAAPKAKRRGGRAVRVSN